MINEVRGTLNKQSNNWYMRIVYVADGKTKYLKRSTGLPAKQSHKKEAQQMLDELVYEYRHKYSLSADVVTVSDLIKRWLKMKESEIRANTAIAYGYQCNRIIEYFSKHPVLVSEVDVTDLKKFFKYEEKMGLSGKTIKEHHSNLKQALDYAIELKLIQTNPARNAKAPKKQKYRPNFLSLEETQDLLKAVKGHKLEIPVTLAFFFGFRRSEVLGLKWNAIDFDRKTLTVEHTTVLVGSAMSDVDKTKTESSYRMLTLSDEMISYLKSVKRRQSENRMRMGKEYDLENLDFICVNPDGTRIKPGYVSQQFPKFLDKHGFRHIRFHDLRHSCASLLISMGYQLKDVQEWLGHASISTTADIYGHLDLARKRQLSSTLSDALQVRLR